MKSWNTMSTQQPGEWNGWTPPYTEWQAFFLHRLVRLLNMRREHPLLRDSQFLGAKLLNRAIYSTYCDCIEQGVEIEARSLFAHDRTTADNY